MLAITKKRRKKLIAEEIDRETSKMRLWNKWEPGGGDRGH
jgi:hypothetical protein